MNESERELDLTVAELEQENRLMRARIERLEATQPKREWVGLTEEDKRYLNEVLNLQGRFPVIDAIEDKLKEKNT